MGVQPKALEVDEAHAVYAALSGRAIWLNARYDEGVATDGVCMFYFYPRNKMRACVNINFEGKPMDNTIEWLNNQNNGYIRGSLEEYDWVWSAPKWSAPKI